MTIKQAQWVVQPKQTDTDDSTASLPEYTASANSLTAAKTYEFSLTVAAGATSVPLPGDKIIAIELVSDQPVTLTFYEGATKKSEFTSVTNLVMVMSYDAASASADIKLTAESVTAKVIWRIYG